MRSSSYRRSARANNLRVFIRDDVPDTVDDVESDSESEDEPDTPSPTEDVFPSPSAGTQAPATPESSIEAPQPTTSTSISAPATQSSSTSTVLSPSTLPQANEPSQAQTAQAEAPTRIMSKDGAIALGTIGGTIIIAAIIFLLWKCRRRQARANGSVTSGFSPFSPFSRFKKMEEPREIYTTNRGSGGKTESKIMDDLMAAAYAAEDGNASQYGAYMDEKQQSYNSMYGPNTRQSNPPQAAVNPDRGSNSLYVNQLMSGFYKGSRADGLTAPANARMPPPVAPSVTGQTEITTTTESTWRTWGWSQKKPTKESWVDKCVRLGGLR